MLIATWSSNMHTIYVGPLVWPCRQEMAGALEQQLAVKQSQQAERMAAERECFPCNHTCAVPQDRIRPWTATTQQMSAQEEVNLCLLLTDQSDQRCSQVPQCNWSFGPHCLAQIVGTLDETCSAHRQFSLDAGKQQGCCCAFVVFSSSCVQRAGSGEAPRQRTGCRGEQAGVRGAGGAGAAAAAAGAGNRSPRPPDGGKACFGSSNTAEQQLSSCWKCALDRLWLNDFPTARTSVDVTRLLESQMQQNATIILCRTQQAYWNRGAASARWVPPEHRVHGSLHSHAPPKPAPYTWNEETAVRPPYVSPAAFWVC